MSNTPHTDLSVDLNSLPGSNSHIIIHSSPRKESRNKTHFQLVQSKILEEANNEDIQLDIEEHASIQGYFKADPQKDIEEEDTETLKKKFLSQKDSNPYETGFKPQVFLKFFIMHMLFFCCMGPLIVILCPIFGWYAIRNQGFIGFNKRFLTQTLEYATVIVFILMYYVTETPGLQGIEVYMLAVAILIRIITISSKYAYQSELFLRLMHTTRLSEEDLTNDLMLGRWRLQTEDIMKEELQASILRLEVDNSLFFFNFLGETAADLKAKFSKENKLSEDENSSCRSLKPHSTRNDSTRPLRLRHKWYTTVNRLISKRNNHKESESVDSIDTPKEYHVKPKKKCLPAQNTIAIHNTFSYFMKTQQLESQYLCGYNLALDLTRNAKATQIKYMAIILLFIAAIRGLLPTLYRTYLVYYKGQDIPILTDKPYIVVLIFTLNALFFWFNIATLYMAVKAFRAKVWCFKQLGYLISAKKINEFQEKKLYPTLNIFDPITLKTWASIRKIMKDYGKKYILRNNFNVTVSMTLYSFVLCTFVLQMLGVFKAYDDPLVLIVFGYETIMFFIIFVSVIRGAAFLNHQYQVHKNLLKKIKNIVADFARLSHLYVGKNSINPDNMIYKEGLKVLKKELGKEDFQAKLIERGEKLICTIDDIIEELEFEECNEPFTVMGTKVDYKLLQSLGLAIISLLFALGQSLINK